jgi:uncharacterized phiE125 gp8 family phage protein
VRLSLVAGPASELITLAEARSHLVVDPAATIVSSSVANPTVITTEEEHGYANGDVVTIANHVGSTPSLNGVHTITVTGARTFTVPVSVSVAGTGGTALRRHPHDAMITGFIVAARGHAQRVTERQLITATWKLKLDEFPPHWRIPITIPMPPLLTVESVEFLDPDGVERTWASSEYVADAPAGPHAIEGRLYPGFEKDYPVTCDRADAVTIEFTAGYGAAASAVPAEIKQAMYLMIGHWYENRESVNVGNIVNELPFAAQALLEPFQRMSALVR